jgi:hypothetical protein
MLDEFLETASKIKILKHNSSSVTPQRYQTCLRPEFKLYASAKRILTRSDPSTKRRASSLARSCPEHFNYEKIDVEELALSDPTLPATILRLPILYGAGACLPKRIG